MITVTENAVKQLQALLESRASDNNADGLRLLVARGGCAGMEYQMKLDSHSDGDSVFSPGDTPIYVDAESLPYLEGCEVDYTDDLTDSGFKINNPNAARSCGCGSSFEPKQEGEEPQYDSADDGSVCGGEPQEAKADADGR
jgi:iron-sulfur cluster assembly protein